MTHHERQEGSRKPNGGITDGEGGDDAPGEMGRAGAFPIEAALVSRSLDRPGDIESGLFKLPGKVEGIERRVCRGRDS